MKEFQGFCGMHWILGEIEEVEQSSSGPDELNGGCATGEIYVDNETKKDPAYVGMFFPSEMGKGGNSICK